MIGAEKTPPRSVILWSIRSRSRWKTVLRSYNVTDTMSKGLTFNNSSLKVTANDAADHRN